MEPYVRYFFKITLAVALLMPVCLEALYIESWSSVTRLISLFLFWMEGMSTYRLMKSYFGFLGVLFGARWLDFLEKGMSGMYNKLLYRIYYVAA